MSRLRAICLTVTLALSMTAADWPQLLGPARDGHSTETKLEWNWPKEGPPVLWKKEIGTGWAGPVVAGGRAYLFHRVGDEEILACYDPADGKEHWASPYATKYRDDFGFDNGPRATPTIAEGIGLHLGRQWRPLRLQRPGRQTRLEPQPPQRLQGRQGVLRLRLLAARSSARGYW